MGEGATNYGRVETLTAVEAKGRPPNVTGAVLVAVKLN